MHRRFHRAVLAAALGVAAFTAAGPVAPAVFAGGGGGRGVIPDRSAVCPKLLTVEPFSTGAIFTVNTKAVATLTVGFSAQVGAGGVVQVGGNSTELVEVKAVSGTRPFTIPAGQLSPDTAYNDWVIARQPNGRTCTLKGTFHTHARSAIMTLSHVHVIDDSDSFGTGELTFDGLVDTHWFCAMDGSWKDLDLGDGADDYTPVSVTQGGVPSKFPIAISVRDDDVDPFVLIDHGTCGMTGSGSDADFDWSTADATITSTPCLCTGQVYSVFMTTPGVPAVQLDVTVTVDWP